MLLNARLIELEIGNHGTRPTISDFNEFLEEIVARFCAPGGNGDKPTEARSDLYGKSIPLTAIAYEEIVVVYPVAHIGALMRRAEERQSNVPRFLDLDKSEIVSLLRTKLW